jgi:hypothetical protein
MLLILSSGEDLNYRRTSKNYLGNKTKLYFYLKQLFGSLWFVNFTKPAFSFEILPKLVFGLVTFQEMQN